MATDLSDLEQRRLDNIRRNAQFLSDLGFDSSRLETKKDDAVAIAASKKREKREREKRESGIKRNASSSGDVSSSNNHSSSSTDNGERRFSRRLRAKPDEVNEVKAEVEEEANKSAEAEDEEDKPLDYSAMPMDSNELDDFEFEVYVALKAWRLKTCRDLDLEPYKICQNRTLCELIRRKRNDLNWAKKKDSGEGEEEEEESEMMDDLLDCWGIGPSKAKRNPPGYGLSMVQLIDEDDQLLSYLKSSIAVDASNS